MPLTVSVATRADLNRATAGAAGSVRLQVIAAFATVAAAEKRRSVDATRDAAMPRALENTAIAADAALPFRSRHRRRQRAFEVQLSPHRHRQRWFRARVVAACARGRRSR